LYESDRALVTRMRAGEQRAFDEFFHSYVPRLVAFTTRRSGLDSASVEDIVQNTLVKAMRSLSSFRGEAALFTWLTQICRHELADVTRKAARQPGLVSLDEPEQLLRLQFQLRLAPSQEPESEVEAQLTRAAVIKALNALPERYSQALEAKYGDGLSVEEIAALMGVTTIAAQSLLARAREAFREQWLASPHESVDGSYGNE
jgi:RNA polymerase sigma-70 factor (ECF subfamily)